MMNKLLKKNNTNEETVKEVRTMARPRISRNIAVRLATNIVDGLTAFKDVPPRYKEAVKEELIKLDAEHLAKED